MATTYSPNLKLSLIGDGEQAGLWGQITNTNLGTLIEQAIAGYSTISITDGDYTLTISDGVSSAPRSMAIRITSSVTLTATRNIICATGQSKLYVVRNATSGGQSIVVKTAAGTGITIANGATAIVFCDGTDVIDPFSSKQAALGYTPVNKAGDTMTGQLNITATNNTAYDIAGPTIAIRNASTTNNTYASVALNNAAGNSSALLFTEYAGTNASRFAIATNPGTTSTSLASRFTVNSDGSFTFFNNASQVIAALDSSGNLSVKGNVTAYAAI
jgi:hypothetical protein